VPVLRVVSAEYYPDWEAVYRDNLDRVYRLMFAKVGNRSDAEDLTAEVFLAALRPLRVSATVGEVRAYLTATARTVLAGYWRRTLGREITTIAERSEPADTDTAVRAGSGESKVSGQMGLGPTSGAVSAHSAVAVPGGLLGARGGGRVGGERGQCDQPKPYENLARQERWPIFERAQKQLLIDAALQTKSQLKPPVRVLDPHRCGRRLSYGSRRRRCCGSRAGT
jgi:hypothetical protein